MADQVSLERYRWQGLPALDNGEKHDALQKLINATSPDHLAKFVSKLENGDQCRVEDICTYGGRHIVRMVTLSNGQRWAARFRIPPSSDNPDDGKDATSGADALERREVDCLKLVSQRTTVPVPQVIAHGSSHEEFETPFIIMDCLPGSCAMNINFNFIPVEHKSKFFKQMANAQVQTTSLLFPMIGSLTLAEDGSVSVGPIPGIGGPFKTAADFFRAWAATTKWPQTEERTRGASGQWADEIWQSVLSFPAELSALAERICAKNNFGPFPLFHVDFGHNNIVVDPEYNILGVIDWEHAYAAPWEIIDYPLTVWVTPQPMDAPWLYDENGLPKNEDLIADYRDREEYLEAVREAEKELNVPPKLSNVLGDTRQQNVATAMRYYSVDGKAGFYTRVLDAFRSDT